MVGALHHDVTDPTDLFETRNEHRIIMFETRNNIIVIPFRAWRDIKYSLKPTYIIVEIHRFSNNIENNIAFQIT